MLSILVIAGPASRSLRGDRRGPPGPSFAGAPPSVARPPANAGRFTATGTKTPPSCSPRSSTACA